MTSQWHHGDITVTSRSQEPHTLIMSTTLKWLHKAGARLRKDKCSFMSAQVKYLGYVIDERGLHPNPERVKAIVEAPTPRSTSELSLFWVYSITIGNFSLICLHYWVLCIPFYRHLQSGPGHLLIEAFEEAKHLLSVVLLQGTCTLWLCQKGGAFLWRLCQRTSCSAGTFAEWWLWTTTSIHFSIIGPCRKEFEGSLHDICLTTMMGPDTQCLPIWHCSLQRWTVMLMPSVPLPYIYNNYVTTHHLHHACSTHILHTNISWSLLCYLQKISMKLIKTYFRWKQLSMWSACTNTALEYSIEMRRKTMTIKVIWKWKGNCMCLYALHDI